MTGSECQVVKTVSDETVRTVTLRQTLELVCLWIGDYCEVKSLEK